MRKQGFTLIELLAVVVIIGIIASLVLVFMQPARARARDSKRVSDIRQIMLALKLYYNDHLQYPEKGVVAMIGEPPKSIDPYLVLMPEDPGNIVLDCQPQGYQWWGNIGQAQKYCLWTCLESGAFFAGSPEGTKTLLSPPSGLDCW